MPEQPPRTRRTATVAIATLLLALHACLALAATFRLGLTADETAHVTSGYAYWRLNDYRLQPENGNLPQRWATLPLLALEPRLVPADLPDYWARSHVWRIGQHFLFESGNDTEFMLLWARTFALAWSVATGLLVFFWSRRLWGDGAGLFSLALFALSPTLLAHGPLVTSDVCAAFWLLAATGAWWRLLQRPTAGRLGWSLLAAAGAAVAKFSCVLLVPTAALLACWVAAAPAPVGLGPDRAARTWRAKLAFFAGLGVVHLAVAWAVVWACFGFRYSAFAEGVPAAWKFYVAWDEVLPPPGVLRNAFDFARAHHVLPEAYLQGFAYVLSAAQERGAFAAGQFSTTGWWWFFPYAFAVKSTLVELVLPIALAALAAVRWTRARWSLVRADLTRFAPLLAFAAVYAAASLTSHLNIGHRHILPLYPVLFILSGALARASLGGRGRVLGVALTAAAVAEVVPVAPHYLAYFNRLAGGSRAGWHHLVDSSLDWGQNLPRVADWVRTHRQPGDRVYISAFGSDDPFYHGLRAQELSPYYSFGRERRWIELEPGLYCVSATLLQDVYSPYAGPWTVQFEVIYRQLLRMMRDEIARGVRSPRLGEFGLGPEHPLWNLDRARFARLTLYLRQRRPVATIGYNYFVYRLDAGELRTIVDGSFAELAAAASAQGN